jgi:Protein of unknown function (DUF2889)
VSTNFEGILPGPVTESAPTRRSNSIRRTSHLDVTRRVGGQELGDLDDIGGAARDLLTDSSGAGHTVATACLAISIGPDGRIATVAQEPAKPACDSLLDLSIGFGFRSGARELLTQLDGSLLGLLVDDLSGAPAPSGYGSIRERQLLGGPALPVVPPEQAAAATGALQTDVCAGWRAEGVPTRHRQQSLEMPFDETPPEAPDLTTGPDPLAWHMIEDPRLRQSRRIRRLDIWRDGNRIIVDSMFRDSTVDPDEKLTQRVVHEYAVSAVLAGDLSEVLEIHADPRSLPFATDCPLAADSAQLIVGQRPSDLRRVVKKVSRGPVSCTHLNDLMRSLADIPHMAAILDQATSIT